MHRLHSRLTIVHFRLAALLLCAKCVLLPLTLGVLIASLVTTDPDIAWIGIALVALTLFAAMLQWICATHTACPLCMTPVLAKKHCITHRHARAFCGSFRLRVALEILFNNAFHCPFCHEKTAIEVRPKSHRK